MGDSRSSDALTPRALGILAARTPPDVAVKLLDERVEAQPAKGLPETAGLFVSTADHAGICVSPAF